MKTPDSRRVLIVEGNADGHRLYYVSLLAAAASNAGDQVAVATTPSALASPEWSLHMSEASRSVAIATLHDYSPTSVAYLANELEVDHVVVPDGDAFAYRLSRGERWSGRGTVSALVMRERGQPSKLPGLALVKTVLKSMLLRIANYQPRVEISVLKSATWRGKSYLPITRDPVSLCGSIPQQDPTADLIPASGHYWFGVVGKVGERKNLPLIAEAIASMNCSDVGLAVAGHIEDGILDKARPFLTQIRAAGGHTHIVDRLLEDAEMDQIIAELDCVVLAHSNDGPSGVLGKAVATGTRIVAAGAATLRTDCRHIGPGAEWVQLNKQALAKAFAHAMGQPQPEAILLASTSEFTSGLLGIRA